MNPKKSPYNNRNERIKRDNFRFLREADQKAESSIDNISNAINRFEEYNRFKDFAAFHYEQAIAFKAHLATTTAHRSGALLSKATILSIINALKAFFRWLATQQGFKTKIHLPHIAYFNLSEKETRIAKSPAPKDVPTLEQIRTALFAMPTSTLIEQRNRALFAFTILTGMRDSAIASLKLKHLNLESELVRQDPNEVNTKFSKRIDTYFFPVDENITAIVTEWANTLLKEQLYSLDAPIFPRNKMGHDSNQGFVCTGIEPLHWQTTSPIRAIFKQAFLNAGLRYFTPHTFRNTLVRYGQQVCKTPEDYKAWSQNLGHESPLTTFISYGTLDTYRQGEVIRKIGAPTKEKSINKERFFAALEEMGMMN
jgi:integrase/recombinase XerD